jgi:hypothetical protein
VVDKGDKSLSQQLSEEVNMILGEVPEMFHDVDAYNLCRRVMECIPLSNFPVLMALRTWEESSRLF